MRFTCSSQKQFVPNGSTHAVHNIVLDPRNKNIVILHNDTNLVVLEKIKVTKRLCNLFILPFMKLKKGCIFQFKITQMYFPSFIHLAANH